MRSRSRIKGKKTTRGGNKLKSKYTWGNTKNKNEDTQSKSNLKHNKKEYTQLKLKSNLNFKLKNRKGSILSNTEKPTHESDLMHASRSLLSSKSQRSVKILKPLGKRKIAKTWSRSMYSWTQVQKHKSKLCKTVRTKSGLNICIGERIKFRYRGHNLQGNVLSDGRI